ncbi:precorrin-2 C(20)-methyltransferase [Candidatus Magnetobacterium bavaricum]|uniref:Precorrin-2 C(20)-methyltransferase n=1 Tax=Candidatus Magnetobacterium bavaricum TaxID=29290 RepID=A0A0F3GYZ7_9BACT|nr:precorrin-2 C(20)-methyltransferase [Candidatus Magnetobacterium bavaricum]
MDMKDTGSTRGIYSLGLGPGDPELITVKAQNILTHSDVVFVPQSDELGRSIARDIVLNYVAEEKIRTYYFPMNNRREELLKRYRELAQTLLEMLQTGAAVTYVTMGDPTIFSTSIYITRELQLLGVEVRHVPGISSINAATALIGLPLCQKGEDFGVYELPKTTDEVTALIHRHHSTVFMKVGKRLDTLVEAVRQAAPQSAFLVQRIGLPDETIYDLLSVTPSAEAGYLSIAIIRSR